MGGGLHDLFNSMGKPLQPILYIDSFSTIVLSVSGTIGFRGILHLVQGEKTVRVEQSLDMIVMALLLIVGQIVGALL